MRTTWRFSGESIDFSRPAPDPTEPLVSITLQHGADEARVPALVDTGCETSLFRFDGLEALGIRPPARVAKGMPGVKVFRGVKGAEMLGFQVPIALRLGSVSTPTVIHATTDPDLDDNYLGRDFLLKFLSAFDLGASYRLILGDLTSIKP